MMSRITEMNFHSNEIRLAMSDNTTGNFIALLQTRLQSLFYKQISLFCSQFINIMLQMILSMPIKRLYDTIMSEKSLRYL